MRYFFMLLVGLALCELMARELDLSLFEEGNYCQSYRLNEIIIKNRNILAQVPCWISDAEYENSIYLYGLPRFARHLIDRPVGNLLTYTDMLVYMGSLLKKPVTYLELGVSVGKNFFQILNVFNCATLIGFDIEQISPVLHRTLGEGFCSKKWHTAQPSYKKDASKVTSYNFNKNENIVHYVNGDVFDEQSWQALAEIGKKFNIIFSDACHEPDALIYEYAMLDKYNLIDEQEFIMVWDDLGGQMSEKFLIIFNHLKEKFNLTEENKRLVDVYGWLGNNESKHTIGVIFKQ